MCSRRGEWGRRVVPTKSTIGADVWPEQAGVCLGALQPVSDWAKAWGHRGSVTTAMFLVVAITLFGAALVLTAEQSQPGCDTACHPRRGEASVVS